MASRPVDSPGGKTNLFGMERPALAGFLTRYAVPRFHADQVYRWIYARRRFDPLDWTDLARPLRESIDREAVVDLGRIDGCVVATDGTRKYRVALAGGAQVECVHMLQAGRLTFCVSSQVGCALDCSFCLTGRMGLVRQLAAGEIVGQVALMQASDGVDAAERFNVVFMGMGEPLHNYDGVMGAVRLLTDADGFALSRRRITVSTSGLAPAIERMARERVLPRLALSLNATTDSERSRLMPINRRYGIERVVAACCAYSAAAGERFTFEYVLLEGVNDADADVARLAALVRRCPAKLNLIPFNPVPDRLPYRPPSRRRIVAFRDRLLELDVPVSIRWSRGAEARAACGQLALPVDAPSRPEPPALPGEELR